MQHTTYPQPLPKVAHGGSWVGTDNDGVYVLDDKHNLIAHITDMPSTILSLAEDKEGKIWAGAYVHGLGYIDPNTLIYNKVELAGIKRLNIFDIKPDSRGNLWIATMGHGLLRYNHFQRLTILFIHCQKEQR